MNAVMPAQPQDEQPVRILGDTYNEKAYISI